MTNVSNTGCFLMRRHREYLEAVETSGSAAVSIATQLAQNELYADSTPEKTATTPNALDE